MTDLTDPVGKERRRGDLWKRMFERADFDRKRTAKALERAEQRAAALEAVVTRVQQMADAWEQRLPETILTATAVDAVRTALERADTAPPMDRVVELDKAIAELKAMPIQCTALTGFVWYGQGWKEAISQLEEIRDRLR